MSFFVTKPKTVEAYVFDGSQENIDFLTEWVTSHGVKKVIGYPEQGSWVSEDGKTGHSGWPAQFDLRLNRVKVAAVGDYVVRLDDEFKVYTEKYFLKTYDAKDI
jgi:hypothetical protein